MISKSRYSLIWGMHVRKLLKLGARIGAKLKDVDILILFPVVKVLMQEKTMFPAVYSRSTIDLDLIRMILDPQSSRERLVVKSARPAK